MRLSHIARAYAHALFDEAAAADRLEVLCADLEALARLMQQAPELAAFVQRPRLTHEQKEAALRALFAQQADPLTLRFLLLLNRKDRLPLIGQIAEAFRARYDEQRGWLPAVVTAAAPLSEAQQHRLQEKIEQAAHRPVRMLFRLDSKLKAGFRVRLGDRVTDLSLTALLNRCRQQLLNA